MCIKFDKSTNLPLLKDGMYWSVTTEEDPEIANAMLQLVELFDKDCNSLGARFVGPKNVDGFLIFAHAEKVTPRQLRQTSKLVYKEAMVSKK